MTGDASLRQFRIDDLAQAAGVTVRNVRAYQDRGLLHPPRREGRTGWYDESHLIRLRVVDALLGRGYSLGNIAELLAGFEHGTQLADLIGLGDVVVSPFHDEVPSPVTVEELVELFGVPADSEMFAEGVRLGLVEVDGDQLVAPSRRLLHAGAELIRAGVPPEVVLAELRSLRRDLDRIATRFVDMVVTNVIDPRASDLVSGEGAGEVAEAVRRIRPLAQMVVDTELNQALERQARRRLGERLDAYLAMLVTDEPTA